MTKHTPGPWHTASDHTTSALSVKVCSETGAVICLLKRAHGNKIENANLIAASPTMLAALEDIYRFRIHFPSLPWGMVEEAIKEAKGL